MTALLLVALVLSTCSLAGVIWLFVLYDEYRHRDWLEKSSFYQGWLEYFIQTEEYRHTGKHVQPPPFRYPAKERRR